MEVFVNTSGAARYLGVSPGTIYNWKRKGLIRTRDTGFHLGELSEFKKELESGAVLRLRSRANKTGSGHTFLPAEYLEHHTSKKDLERLIAGIRERGINPETAAFCLVLNRCLQSGDIQTDSLTSPAGVIGGSYTRTSVKDLIEEWSRVFSHRELENESLGFLLVWRMPPGGDIPGIIYQALLQEGRKARKGSYYTPPDIARSMAENMVKEGMTVLDPCCGTGQFLLAAARIISDPSGLLGWDSDATAVRIASANILHAFPDEDRPPGIMHLDSLLKGASVLSPGSVDCILTNPPWGMRFSQRRKDVLTMVYPEVSSGESFSYFLILSLRLIKQGGRLAFVLPESFTNIGVHEDIRRVLLEETCIEYIRVLGRRFRRVFSKVICIGLRKGRDEGQEVLIVHPGNSFSFAQAHFRSNPRLVLDIYSTSRDREIIEQMYRRPYVSLENNAVWGLGIVTGDNKSLIHSTPGEGRERICTGANVKAFSISPMKKYLRFSPDLFQQNAPLEIYRAREKLIYRFISSKPVFAYDSDQTLTLNSANICIPRLAELSIFCVLGLLNSDLYAFLYKKRFHTLRILRSDLERLPLPILSEEEQTGLEALVHGIMDKTRDIESLNEYIFDLFSIPPEKRGYISSEAEGNS